MSVSRLLNPRSVAIVGASDRVGPGLNAWLALQNVGFDGEVHLVNPNRPELFDRPTVPSLAEVPGAVDAVFIAIQQERVVDTVRDAIKKGAGGAAILSSGFGEAGPDGIAAQEKLRAVAEEAGLAVCGPNCLGLLNFAGKAALFGTSMPDDVPRGRVAAIVQSGSIGIALLNETRGIGLSHLITSGNEAVTSVADYMDVLVDDPGVGVIIAFLEQLRKPEAFLAVARRARAQGKPVIVLKSGRSARGQEAVLAHTGAVAGSDAVCDAVFREAGIVRVSSLDELIECGVLFSGIATRPTAPGVAILSPSGGEIALALDAADAAGLDLPVPWESVETVRDLLPDFANIANPLDLTWAGLYDPTVAQRCAAALGSEKHVGLVALLQDAPAGLNEQQSTRYAALIRGIAEGAREAGVPMAVVSNLSGALHPVYDAAAADSGTPCLRGTQEGIFALAQYMRWATDDAGAAAPPAGRSPAYGDAAALLDVVANPQAPTEIEARAIVEAYGLSGPEGTLAQDAGEAAAVADGLGYPVVLKGVVDGVSHKSELGLVHLGARSADEVRAAADSMLARARAAGGAVRGLLVQRQVTPVAELLVGARVDPQFGPIIVVGGGGVTVELYEDVAIRLAPVTEREARAMLAETKASRLLSGWRGRPEGDVEATAAAIAALSRLIHDFRDRIAEVEINPLAVLEAGSGCQALDCLIVPRGDGD